jgi:hypothetical protein
MRYQIIVKDEITNVIRKNKEDIIDAKNEEEAKELASQLYTSDANIELKRIITLTCYHKDEHGKICNYTWDYSGNRTKCATCPDCHKQVYIDSSKRKVK